MQFFPDFDTRFAPLSKASVCSAAIFQSVWTWNDFFNSLIYINSVSKYPVSLGLRMSLDSADAAHWNEIFAMSIVSIIPCVILFFTAQKYFVEGIATSGGSKGRKAEGSELL